MNRREKIEGAADLALDWFFRAVMRPFLGIEVWDGYPSGPHAPAMRKKIRARYVIFRRVLCNERKQRMQR